MSSVAVNGQIVNLFFYPIKGLTAQRLDHVTLKPGEGFPMDRAFGFARPNSGFDPQNPKPLPKTCFVVLARDAKLALLKAEYNFEKNQIRLFGNEDDLTVNLSNSDECDQASKFIADHLGFSVDERPTLYSAAPHRFTDVSVVSAEMMNAVSLINLDSVKAFSHAIGETVDEARFRGNIIFSGIDPFAELEWVGRIITIGEVQLKVVKRTKRCAATQVSLKTGERDINVPKLLRQHYGHLDMGVYAEVMSSGVIKPGDAVKIA